MNMICNIIIHDTTPYKNSCAIFIIAQLFHFVKSFINTDTLLQYQYHQGLSFQQANRFLQIVQSYIL